MVISRTTVVSPDGGSLMDTLSTSPGFSFSVFRLPSMDATVAVCGPGGPAGMPLVCRNAALTGSMQLLLHFAKPYVHSRLSMVSALHHRVALQLSLSGNGVNPGG